MLNNALSGLDQALWHITGKMAGMPVYQLLGGKTRFAVDTYGHASGRTTEEVMDDVERFREKGYKNIRIQLGGYGSTHLSRDPDWIKGGFGTSTDNTMDPQAYKRGTIEIFKKERERFGDDIELLHDMYERLQPMDAIDMIQRVEEYRPFFIEDPLSPENNGWFKLLGQKQLCLWPWENYLTFILNCFCSVIQEGVSFRFYINIQLIWLHSMFFFDI